MNSMNFTKKQNTEFVNMKLRQLLMPRVSQKLKLRNRQLILVGGLFIGLIVGIVAFIFNLSKPDSSLAENVRTDSFRSFQGMNFQKIVRLSDGNFVASDGASFIKMDSIGSVIWSKTVTVPYSMLITGLSQTNDGEIVAVCQSSDTSNYKIGVIRLTKNGGLRWFRIFSAKGSDFAYGIMADNDNGVVLTGGGCNISHFIMKIDADGNANWMKDFAIANTTGSAYKILTEDNGNMLIAGRITSHGNHSISLMMTDEFGNFLWGKQIADQQLPVVKSIIKTTDGNYILAGVYISQAGAPTLNPFMIKTDPKGNVIWFRRIGNAGYESINDLAATPDGGAIAVGNIYLDEAENVNALIFRMDAQGNLLWQKTAGNSDFNGAGYDDAYSICRNSSNNYCVIGMAYWAFLSKMDENGIGFCHETPVTLAAENVNAQSSNAVYLQVPGDAFTGETIPATVQNMYAAIPNSCSATQISTSTNDINGFEKSEVMLFPNPNDGNFNVNYTLPENSKGQIIIFDLSGKQVTAYDLPSFTHSVSIHQNDLTSGIYLYKVMGGEKVLAQDKFVVAK